MILVTGATGLVGGNLLWHLLQDNEHVTAIRRPTSNLKPLHTIFSFYTTEPDKYLARIDWRMADVLDPLSLRNALTGISEIYHCAAVVSLGGSADILLDTNVIGTKNIVEASLTAGISKLCFVSSIAACGRETGNKPIDENSVWTDSPNRSLYSRSKYYSEQEVWKGIERGLNAVIVNPGVILGVSGTNSGSSQLFYRVQKGLAFYTNGGSGYVDVQDVAKAMMRLMQSDISGQRYVLVAENCSNKDILNLMADGFGKPRPFIGMGKPLLLTIGFVAEMLGKIFRFQPLIDRGTARSATHREYYSAQKIETALLFRFKPMKTCIDEVCRFMQGNENSAAK